MAVSNELYTEVLQFYAKQMQALDNRDFAFYADTFTEEGEFTHSPNLPAARGPQEIRRTLEEFHRAKFGDQPVQRRHWFNHVVLDALDDGRISSTCYALVITTRPDTPPEITPSCVVHDVLVRWNGALRMLLRRVHHDGEIATSTTAAPGESLR